jgi:hypothetical protein
MSIMRSSIYAILYDGMNVRDPYIDLVLSLITSEFNISSTYIFFDGTIKREGTAYILGNQEVYFLERSGKKPRVLRENILDLLALNPLYAKWFG